MEGLNEGNNWFAERLGDAAVVGSISFASACVAAVADYNPYYAATIGLASTAIAIPAFRYFHNLGEERNREKGERGSGITS